MKRQLFVYRGRAESQVWGEGGPQDGSRRGFLYGDGWSKGRAVYDPVHRIAYLNTGCCTEFASVLTLAPPPPEPLPARDLTEVHTTLGLRLGDSPERVRAVLGVDTEHAVEGFAGLEVLSYYVMQTAACGTWHNVYFRKARAVRIEVVTAC